ncbi:MAG: Rho termination factor N-terminal domain-containing protein [Solirubrobacterales bacterium]|nr:Rho termination factor N-terminal domain-containing protein [Solirubrobacterales bacterium]
MPVLDRSALNESPLADLHAIASELSIDGYRRLRRPELIAAIIDKQAGGDGVPAADVQDAPAPATARGGRGRGRSAKAADAAASAAETAPEAASTAAETAPEPASTAAEAEGDTPASTAAKAEGDALASASAAAEAKGEPRDDSADGDDEDGGGARRRRGRRGGRGRGSAAGDGDGEAGAPDRGDEDGERDETAAEGVVELLANGSGFIRAHPPEVSDDDVYISSAQVKRCELVPGDRVSGPRRAPRRSERFASLIRVETINGRPASELADSTRFDDLPAAMPSERLKVGSEDPTLKAIEWLTPFGKGSRVTITGAARAGKSEALRRLAGVLAEREELTLSVALVGVRPEEISEWAADPVAPAAAVSFAASADAQSAAVEPVIDQARRLATRGADAVVLIDTLDGCTPQTARRVLASARNHVDGGSLTVIATATAPLGGETTVISLDVGQASIGRFPALDLLASGTLRPELLVGDAGAEAIARTRAEVLEDD